MIHINGNNKSFTFGSNGIVGIITGILFFVLLFYIAKGIFTILAYLTPVLFIATLIINHQVVIDYGKMLYNTLKNNPLMGIIGIGLTFIGFPIVAFFLFGKSLMLRKVNKLKEEFQSQFDPNYQNQTKEEFVNFEEVDSTIINEETPIEIKRPVLEINTPVKKKDDSSKYDDLFN